VWDLGLPALAQPAFGGVEMAGPFVVIGEK
jgi:hypothetical protein